MAIDWVFDPEPPSGAADGGDPAIHVFRPNLGSFVREVLQNANDEQLSGSASPVSVEFRLIRLSPAHSTKFLKSIRWDSLRPHLEAASQSQNGLTIKSGLRNIDEGAPLDLLLIADSGTNGLLGPERRSDVTTTDSRNSFLALCKDKLFGDKASPTSGGTHGLGKAVLWCFSSLTTVLFSSNPFELPSRTLKSPRFIGRCTLPWHKFETGTAWNGSGWLGSRVDTAGTSRADSLWGAEAASLSTELLMPRAAASGTSILIVGFREPAHEERSLADIARDIRNAASENFWPCLDGVRPRLKMSVAIIEDGRESAREGVSIQDSERPMLEAYNAYLSGNLQESLKEPGDVVAVDIPVRVPRTIADGHSEISATSTLLVRLLKEDEVKLSCKNRIFYFRSARMVVKNELVQQLPVSSNPFVAIVLAGGARNPGTSSGDEALEKFLQFSEPPEHDDWQVTRKIKDRYRVPYAEPLEQLPRSVKQKIRELVRQRSVAGAQGPRLLMKRFPIGSAGGGKSPQTLSIRNVKAKLDSSGVWRFEGVAELLKATNRPWEFSIEMRFVEEGGATVSKGMIGSIKCKAAKASIIDGSARISAPASASTIKFEGLSDPSRYPVDSNDAVIEIAVEGQVLSLRGEA